MATSQHDSSHQQAGVDKYIDYYDIMLLGKTGMGKTTTADKILMANPTKKDYTYVPPGQEDSDVAVSTGIPDNDHTSQDTSTSSMQSASSASGEDAANSSSTQCHDISMWHLSDKQGELESVSLRLKNLVFWRGLENPHEEVNTTRQENSKSTEKCELLSNDTSKVRVLDVPGFYGPNAACNPCLTTPTTSLGATETVSTSVRERAQATTETDLSIMRKILHIKMAKKFKFNRIVYFLPETGVLSRDSSILQMEIGIMENYFGRSIFECMVVVATHNQSSYKKFAEGVDLYTLEEFETTRRFFQAAMNRVFPHDAPVPPIIFLSLYDTCDEVLCKIRDSKVVREGVNLNFNPSTCARCSIKIGRLTEESHKKKSLKEGEKEKDVVATCTHGSWSSAILYEESTCHPMMIPKYSKIECVAGGIAHLFTLKIFWGKWPSFGNLEEVCINCGLPPKERGCLRVGTEFVHSKSTKGSIHVDHTSEVKESFVIVLDPDDEPREDDIETMAVMGHKYSAAKHSQAYFVKKQEEMLKKGGGEDKPGDKEQLP